MNSIALSARCGDSTISIRAKAKEKGMDEERFQHVDAEVP